jgi:predicted permease
MRWFRKDKFETEMSEEMLHHVELQTELNRKAGMNAEDARYAALRQFGNVAVIQEQTREGRGWVWLEQVGQDVRYALRSLGKTPVFAGVAIVTLAFGIGANTALFSVLDAMLLRSLPVKNPGELVVFSATGPSAGATQSFPYPLLSERDGTTKLFPLSFYERFKSQVGSLSVVAASNGWIVERQTVAPAAGLTGPVGLQTESVSGSYFTMMGINASVGRMLGAEDDQAGRANPVVVLSHETWQRHFASDPAIIGQSVRIDRTPVTVIGVGPPGFVGATGAGHVDLWVPLQLSGELDRGQPWAASLKSDAYPFYAIFGRLDPGVSRERAAAELDALYQAKLAELDPRRANQSRENEQTDLVQRRITLRSAAAGYGFMRDNYRKPGVLLAGMVCALLAVACANVAGLLLAKGAAREREFAVRAALGASRWRLFRQVMLESLLLALLGGLVGGLVAWGGTHWLGDYLGRVDLRLDQRVMGFALIVTALTGVVFGLVPALRLSRVDLVAPTKAGPGNLLRLNAALVVGQIALAFLLCTVAVLLVRTFQNLLETDLGFQRQQLTLATIQMDPDTPVLAAEETYRRLTETIKVMPGIKEVSTYRGISLISPVAFRQDFKVKGFVPASNEPLKASIAIAGSDFFKTMGIPLRRGTDFVPRAANDHRRQIVISEWSAKKLFGDGDPMGKWITLEADFEIVGVAGDIKYSGLTEAPGFVFYVPQKTRPSVMKTMLAIRTTEDGRINLTDLRSVLHQISPSAQLLNLSPLEDRLTGQTRRERMLARLAAFFGVFVLLLSCLGLFGVQAFNVTRRTHELGVRLALGATREGLLLMVIRKGLILAVAGAALGFGASLAVSRLLGSLLHGVSPTEPSAYVVVLASLLGAALLASWLPARRAAKVDPMVALRAE